MSTTYIVAYWLKKSVAKDLNENVIVSVLVCRAVWGPEGLSQLSNYFLMCHNWQWGKYYDCYYCLNLELKAWDNPNSQSVPITGQSQIVKLIALVL